MPYTRLSTCRKTLCKLNDVLKRLSRYSAPNAPDSYRASPQGAAGLFQLMTPTAKRFGLSTWPVDDRLKAEPSAQAAAKYLKYLHSHFHDWRLALAALAWALEMFGWAALHGGLAIGAAGDGAFEGDADHAVHGGGVVKRLIN